MSQIVIWGLTALSVVNIVSIVIVFIRLTTIQKDKAAQPGKEGFDSLREEVLRSKQEIRDEVVKSQTTTANLTTQVEGTRNTVDERFQTLQQSNETRLDKIRETVTAQLQSTTDTLVKSVGELGKAQDEQLDNIRKTVNDRLEAMQTTSEEKSGQMHTAFTNQLQSTAETLANSVGELRQSQEGQLDNIRKTVNDRLEAMQTTSEEKSEHLHTAFTNQLQSTTETLVNSVGELRKAQEGQLDNIRKTVNDRLEAMQTTSEERSEHLHTAFTNQLQSTTGTLVNSVGKLGEAQDTQLGNVTKAISDLTESNETRIEKVRTTVDSRLQAMQESNEDKLEKMRKTVDEKLQSTLEKRLGESFNQVSKQLDEVHQGLGEMRELASGVGDLKRVLANVKTRGIWGEVQLGSLLEDVLTSDQYSSNVQLNENSREAVEYAVRLPGNGDDPNACVWLPIDSKFPLADYERLVETSEAADKKETDKASATFLKTVDSKAKTICEKYIAPPKTTDFAIMFLPTEGLYAEVLRSAGQVERLLNHQVIVAGPTTLAAILMSLRVGFRTLAIEKRSSEVWDVLAAVKTEFGKYAGVMDKLGKQLATASKTVDATGTRTRAIERRLRKVEELPLEEANALLELSSADLLNEDPADE